MKDSIRLGLTGSHPDFYKPGHGSPLLRMCHISLITPNKCPSPRCDPQGLTSFILITSLASPSPSIITSCYLATTPSSHISEPLHRLFPQVSKTAHSVTRYRPLLKYYLFLFFFLKDYIYFRERGREGEREEKKH